MLIMNCWYIFNGVPNGELNPVNYAKTIVAPDCPGGKSICAVFAPNCGGVPTNPFPAALANAIQTAMVTGMEQTVDNVVSVLLKP